MKLLVLWVALAACSKSEPKSAEGAVAQTAAAPQETACERACAHRAECLPEASDRKQCLGACTGIAVAMGDKATAVLDTYSSSDCASVKQQEPELQQASACVRGCKHVIECGVTGTFESCVAQCARNIQAKSLTLEQIAAITTADCTTVKQQVSLTPPAPAAGASCESVCRNYDSCQVQPYAACMAECVNVEPARLVRFARASCDQLRTGDLGDLGFGCLRQGKQDCQPGMMCCRNHRATLQGEPGMCLYAALCYHTGF